MQQDHEKGHLFILGGENVRFLVEEPVRMALAGVKVVNSDSETACMQSISAVAASLSPICLVASAESLPDNVAGWIAKKRADFPCLPIVILDHRNSRLANFEFLPQLVEAVAIIKYPYTQKAVIDAIEKSVWWSRNLCRMLERVGNFSNLSERELAIVSMATDGVPNKTMARRLEVSIKTIEKNRRTAYEKLKISSSAEMAALVTFRRYFNRDAAAQERILTVAPTLNPNISVHSMPTRVAE